MTTKHILKSSLLAAFTAICSVVSLPVGTIPVTLGVFAVLFSATTSGRKTSVTATLVYILTGVCGLPVFSGFCGGIGVLLGPGGGYIAAYVLMALIVGAVSDKCKKKSVRFVSCLIALFVCYALGTLHYCAVMRQKPLRALMICVCPFIPFDILKCALAVILGGKAEKVVR